MQQVGTWARANFITSQFYLGICLSPKFLFSLKTIFVGRANYILRNEGDV